VIANKVMCAYARDIQYQYVTNLLKMGQIYRENHPKNNYMQFPHSIIVHCAIITGNFKAQSSSPQDLSMYASIFIPYGPTEFPLRSSVKQERCANTVTHHLDQKVIHER
jgi:hypothetical protein